MNDGRFIDGRFMFTFGWGVERNTLLKIYDLLSPIETSSAIEKQKNSDGTDVSMLQTIIPVSSIILAESSYAHTHHLIICSDRSQIFLSGAVYKNVRIYNIRSKHICYFVSQFKFHYLNCFYLYRGNPCINSVLALAS